MKTGFRGTFVIPWSQTELDGQRSAPVADLRIGAAWCWTGEAVRVDGPSGVMPLGLSQGDADLRRRVAPTVRRLLASARVDAAEAAPVLLQDPLFDTCFVVTDGRETWEVVVIRSGAGRKPLLMFHGDLPPRATDLWLVRHNLDPLTRQEADVAPQGVICFTPGTMILTPDGPCDVAALREGDRVQTADNGQSEILWLGRRKVTGARLQVMPHLRPVRLRAGALDKDVPDAGLLVSPDHRIVLRGPKARALFNAEEILVTARDLVDDSKILYEQALRSVTYIHMLLPQHEVVFANGVATESFHPASAALSSLAEDEQARLFERLPDVRGDAASYGPFARRLLKQSEAAILQHDGRGQVRH